MKDGIELSGEIINVEILNSEAEVTVLIGRDLICVPIDLDKAGELKPGEKIIVSTERFDPVINKIK